MKSNNQHYRLNEYFKINKEKRKLKIINSVCEYIKRCPLPKKEQHICPGTLQFNGGHGFGCGYDKYNILNQKPDHPIWKRNK